MNRTLNLILQKKFAKEIIKGEKVREYRDYTPFYINRLIDFTKVSEELKKAEDAPRCKPIAYDRIKFYWYTKEYLIVECLGWSVVSIEKLKQYTPDAIRRDCKRFLAEEGEKTLYDVMVENDEYEFDGLGEDEPFIVFQLGRVIENNTNIK